MTETGSVRFAALYIYGLDQVMNLSWQELEILGQGGFYT